LLVDGHGKQAQCLLWEGRRGGGRESQGPEITLACTGTHPQPAYHPPLFTASLFIAFAALLLDLTLYFSDTSPSR